jgi:predicted small metal-binding protein
MITCPHPDCGWQSLAPSEGAAYEQYASHVVEVHGEWVETEVPEGTIEVRHETDGDWRRIPTDELFDSSGDGGLDDPQSTD